MNREIKFRAFSNLFGENKMVPVTGMSVMADGVWFHADDADRKRAFNVESGKVMQFTGLKDKNGVEIYEGDVIRIDVADEDEYRNGSPYVMFEKGCFAYRYSHWSDDLCIVLYQTANQMLIVGNIYENPELLS